MTLNVIKTRGEADKVLSQHVDSIGVKQFLLKNLYWKDQGQLAWRINIPVLEKNISNILAKMDSIELHTQTLFIRGAQSSYILDEDIDELEEFFTDFQLVTIENAGHWVHAESPEIFIETVLSFCLR